jgi:hypothetical protein
MQEGALLTPKALMEQELQPGALDLRALSVQGPRVFVATGST